MGLIYIDKSVKLDRTNIHPAYVVCETSNMLCMERRKIGEKSVFNLTIKEALELYSWYCVNERYGDIETEFGDKIYTSEFVEILSNSYYMERPADVSDLTIAEQWEAQND